MKVSTAGSSDAYPTFALLRRLLVDEALAHWPRYALASSMLGIAAAATALGAYLIGTLTNEAYLSHNFRGIVILGIVVMAIFAAKGLATYFGAVMLSRIGNRIIADNQRRMFDKLLRENMSFFADRHSSEFIARLTTGAQAVSSVINLLITAIGRDLMSLIGLSIVMVTQDPVMSLAGFVAAPPAIFFLRKLVRRVRNIARMQFTGGTRIIETMQEALQGLRMVKAFSLEDEMQRRLDVSVTAVELEFEQDGARLQSRRSADGDARRRCRGAGDDLWRLSRDFRRRHAGPIRFLPGGVPARLRAGETTGAAQHGSQQQPGRRACACTRSSTVRRANRRMTIVRRSSSRPGGWNSPTSASPIAPARRCCAA